MTDYPLNAEPGVYSTTGAQTEGEVRRVAETWQFFAFVFAGVVTLALALLDEVPNERWRWRLGLKVLAFLAIGYCTLRSRAGRNALVRLLDAFKTERYDEGGGMVATVLMLAGPLLILVGTGLVAYYLPGLLILPVLTPLMIHGQLTTDNLSDILDGWQSDRTRVAIGAVVLVAGVLISRIAARAR